MNNRTIKMSKGDRYGNFTVEYPAEIKRAKEIGQEWVVSCDCGTKAQVLGHRLRNNRVSCTNVLCKNKTVKRKRTLNEKFGQFKTLAKKRGKKNSLTYEEYIDLIQSPCYYCKLPPQQGSRYLVATNEIDRKNNTLDYSKENCVPCCPTCNRMKGTSSIKEFLERVKNIVDRI